MAVRNHARTPAVSDMESAPQNSKICQRLGIDVESAKNELKGFSDTTDVSKLASDLEDRLPEH
jgi:hypothetical protein